MGKGTPGRGHTRRAVVLEHREPWSRVWGGGSRAVPSLESHREVGPTRHGARNLVVLPCEVEM